MTSPAVTKAVVIGGGLAGLTAAIDLRDAGASVTLIEARPRLGGAASSYRRGAMTVDNGQHVFLRCCTSYQDLLARLGATGSVLVQDRFDVAVLSPGGEARLRRTSLPGPLHFSQALLGYPLLSLRQRLSVGRAALAMRFADPQSAELDQVPLGEWLAARGQDERTRRALWDLFIVSAMNIAGDQASTALAATVIKMALLGARGAADIGIAQVPLGDLHHGAAGDLLARLGVTVRLGTRVSGIERQAGGGFSLELGDAALQADAVVLAVPAVQAARLGAMAGLKGAGQWEDLGASPIVNVHVIYDRQVTDRPFAAGVDSPVQWVFDKTRQAGVTSGQYLAISLSAADDYVDVPVAQLREQFLPALEQLFPAAATAGITDFFVTRERRATFRQGPRTARLRPQARTDITGLVLTGAWTSTGWPDTMEGAVRSGHNGAQELVRQIAAGELTPTARPVSASGAAS